MYPDRHTLTLPHVLPSCILSDLADSPESLWTALEDNGLTRVWAAEADGGFDLAPADGFGLMRLAGAHAAPVPLADTLMASWFLTEAKLPVPPRSEEHKTELQAITGISYAGIRM